MIYFNVLRLKKFIMNKIMVTASLINMHNNHMLHFCRWVTNVSLLCICGTCWCADVTQPSCLIMQAVILYRCLCKHDLYFNVFSELVFFSHSVLSFSIIWSCDKRKTPIISDFRIKNRFPVCLPYSVIISSGRL